MHKSQWISRQSRERVYFDIRPINWPITANDWLALCKNDLVDGFSRQLKTSMDSWIRFDSYLFSEIKHENSVFRKNILSEFLIVFIWICVIMEPYITCEWKYLREPFHHGLANRSEVCIWHICQNVHEKGGTFEQKIRMTHIFEVYDPSHTIETETIFVKSKTGSFPVPLYSILKSLFNVVTMWWNLAWTNRQLWTDLFFILYIVTSRI